MDILEINGLHVRTEVGFSEHELGKLQELVITIQIQVSRQAGNSDCVHDAINLKPLIKEVSFHVENKRYNLVEAVATDVARICVVRHGIPWVKVNVQKPNALCFSQYSSVTIERRLDDFEMKDVHLSIGSNINPFQNIPKALDLLKEKFEIIKLSKAFRTTPFGFKEQEDFVNMAVVLRSKLDLEGIKLFISDVEQQLGRTRDANNKHGPRTIDLDISFWGDSVVEYKMERDLKTQSWLIPDPDTLKLAHVIIPLADVTPDFIHPLKNKPLKLIAAEVTGVDDFASFFPTVEVNETANSTNDDQTMPGLDPIKGCLTHSARKDAPLLRSLQDEKPVALITGAAKRLGAATARQLHAAGYNITIHYNNSKVQATALCQELNSVRIDSTRLIQADLSSDVQNTAERIVRECLEVWGRLDVLVNNASQFYPTEVGATNEKDWNTLMHTNLSAPFFLSQAAFPSLKFSRGCIINITDVHAHRPYANHTVYCISKAGLHMCTLALAKEFAPYVRVNGVAPGAILWKEGHEGSPSEETTEEKRSDILRQVPMGRLGNINDIASAVEYFASTAAGYITGQVIDVDGGRTLNQ